MGGRPQSVRQRQGVVSACQGLRWVPQYPEGQRGKDSGANTRIDAHAEHQSTVLVWRVACDDFLQVQAGSRQCATVELCLPKSIVGEDSKRGIVVTLRKTQQRFPKLSCRVEL